MLKRVAHSLGLAEQRGRDLRRSKVKGRPRDFSTQSGDFVVKITHAGGHQELYKHAVPAWKLMMKYPGMCVAKPEVFKIPHQSVLWREELLLPGHKYILISSKHVEKLKRKHQEQGESNLKEPNKETRDTKTKSPIKENDKVHVPKLSPSEQNHKEDEKREEPKLEMLELETRINVSPIGCKVEEKGEDIVDKNMDDGSLSERVVEDSFFSAKDFYVHKEKSNRYSRRKGIKGKKPFVAPLPKARAYRSLGWQPSLPTVKELSP